MVQHLHSPMGGESTLPSVSAEVTVSVDVGHEHLWFTEELALSVERLELGASTSDFPAASASTQPATNITILEVNTSSVASVAFSAEGGLNSTITSIPASHDESRGWQGTLNASTTLSPGAPASHSVTATAVPSNDSPILQPDNVSAIAVVAISPSTPAPALPSMPVVSSSMTQTSETVVDTSVSQAPLVSDDGITASIHTAATQASSSIHVSVAPSAVSTNVTAVVTSASVASTDAHTQTTDAVKNMTNLSLPSACIGDSCSAAISAAPFPPSNSTSDVEIVTSEPASVLSSSLDAVSPDIADMLTAKPATHPVASHANPPEPMPSPDNRMPSLPPAAAATGHYTVPLDASSKSQTVIKIISQRCTA